MVGDRRPVAFLSALRRPQLGCLALFYFLLWAGAGAPEGVHAGGRWGPMARRRRRFFGVFFLFSRFFTCFHGNSAYLRPCYHALRQPVGAADRAMMHN